MSIWFTEELHPYYRKGIRVKRVLADEQTKYQHLQFVETEFFGNAMILDGIIQLTERDNMGYHEMIVHVPMLAVGKPKRVLLIGGGDGGSLQQVLRYPSVEEVSICELDQRVVDLYPHRAVQLTRRAIDKETHSILDKIEHDDSPKLQVGNIHASPVVGRDIERLAEMNIGIACS